jgi:hypothetical protein
MKKEVDFYKYCKECIHIFKTESEEPCNKCLDHPCNEDSEKPINFKKEKKNAQ